MEQHWLAHKDRIRKLIASKIPDATLVDDLMQDVFLRAYTQSHQLKSEASVGGWLGRIAFNVTMDYFRKHKNFEELSETLEAEEEDELEKSHQQAAQCLVPFIERLPDNYRIPLEMAELQGMSQQAVADALGLTLSAAKSRIQRARAQLKKQLTECCHIELSQGLVADAYPKSPNSGCCKQ